MNNPYAWSQKEKEKILLQQLNQLTVHHRKSSPHYAKLLQLFYPHYQSATTCAEIPYLPVNLFKTADLLSIPQDLIFKIIRSSGTTTTQPSKIYLDAETSRNQSQALADIMISFLGEKRLPLLVIDNPQILHKKTATERQNYTARDAALMGMMSFGRDITYALDEEMNINQPSIDEWLEKHQNGPCLIFGMTFIIWKHFLTKTLPIHLPQGILMHTGGWKKMEEEAISNALFKQKLKEVTAINHCYNFYGMAEQVGSVFVECEKGHLHCPQFSEILFRDPISWDSVNEGIVQVLSCLPTSYPGHSLLTEDLGRLIGVDDCPCGRKGKYFHIQGRVPKAEIRGCSDTYAAMAGQL